MKALVFAAGIGSRLKPFTLHHPKALAEVGGIPMLARVITKLRDAGVDEMVVNVHHFAGQIIEFLEANNNFGVKIHISDETGELLDTGGGLLKARGWLDGYEPFIVHNADILTDFDINEMVRFHNENQADATLLVAPRKTSRYLYFDNRLRGWMNISTGEARPQGFLPGESMTPYAFGGVHVVSPKIFDRLAQYTDKEVFSIVPFYVAEADVLNILPFVQPQGSLWVDIGKPENLAYANSLLNRLL